MMKFLKKKNCLLSSLRTGVGFLSDLGMIIDLDYLDYINNHARAYSSFNREDKLINFSKKNTKIKYFDYDASFRNLDYFYEELSPHIKYGDKYAFLMKIKRSDNTFGMGGNCIPVNTKLFGSKKDGLDYLHKKLIKQLNYFIEFYKDDDFLYISILFCMLKSFPDLELKNVNKLKLNKELLNISATKKSFNDNILPLSANTYYYGDKLQLTNKDGLSCLMVNDKNIADDIKNNSMILSDSMVDINKLEFYLYKGLNNYYVILIYFVSKTDRKIEVFDCDGEFVLRSFDYVINDKQFIRKIGKMSIYIDNNEVTKYEISDVLPSILKRNYKEVKTITNTKIGVLDLETYYHSLEDKTYVYCLGFRILEEDEKRKFYKNINQASEDLVLECINAMLTEKYHNFIFYVHNLSGFDVVFILSALSNFNLKYQGTYKEEYYKLIPVFRDGVIIKLTIIIKKNKRSIKINLVDSYPLLMSSLSKLSRDFECTTIKTPFPYQFVEESTLYYIGDTPDKKYFEGITDYEYSLINKPNWDLKQETFAYLDNDLDCLMEVINKFSKYIFKTYDIQLTDCITVARLSLNILHKKYLQNKSKLPLITKPSIFFFIKQAYYGGISEVYKPYVENAFYYDVNSEYPYVAKNKMPGTEYTYIESLDGSSLNLDELFGYFYCEVKTNNSYLGLLPNHINGSLILPHGNFNGVWFSEHLKFVRDCGYEIKPIKGYNFNVVDNVFNDFVDDLYKIRLNTSGSVKAITKLLLNSPFGRLGMNINKYKSSLVDKNNLDYIISIHDDVDFKQITENKFLVTHDSEISREKCHHLGLDYVKVLNKANIDEENSTNIQDVSITTAAAITSYAQIYITKIKL